MSLLWFLMVCLISSSCALDNHDHDDELGCIFAPGGRPFGPEHGMKVNPKSESKHVLSTEGFPDCCKPGKWELKSSDGKAVNWKIIFTDIDLPLGSKLCINGRALDGHEDLLYKAYTNIEGPPGQQKVIVPTDADSSWYRRSAISFQGTEISVIFLPPIYTHYPHHTGFQIEFWIDRDEKWNDGLPVVDCPPMNDPIFGGQIKMSSATQTSSDNSENAYYDCRWQMKTPDSDFLDNYIRLTALSLPSGKLKIYQGICSPDKSASEDHQNIVFEGTDISREIFLSSRKGFFIELEKPVREGVIEFTYGVGQSLLEDEECEFNVGKSLIMGFRCNSGSKSYCIPNEGLCDSIENCPDGEDENEEQCEDEKETTIKFSPSAAHDFSYSRFLPKYCSKDHMCEGRECRKSTWRCPEKGCTTLLSYRCPVSKYCVSHSSQCPENLKFPDDMVLCDNGMFVSKYHGVCPKFNGSKPCGDSHKICRGGQCISRTARCPEDPCPEWKPYKCDHGLRCYYSSERCDGTFTCFDGEDEGFCTDSIISGNDEPSIHWWIWLIVAVAILFILISLACCLLSWRKSNPPATVCEAQGYSGIPMQSASDEQEPQSSPNLGEKSDFISGNATLEGFDAYETLNSGKTFGQGYQEGCMQFY